MGSRRKTSGPEAEPNESTAKVEHDPDTGLSTLTVHLPDLGLPSVAGNATDNAVVPRADIIAHIESYLDAMVQVRASMAKANNAEDWAYNSIEDLLKQRGTLLPASRFTVVETRFLREVFDHYNEPARLGDCYQVAGDLTMHAQWILAGGKWGPEIWSIRYGEGLGMAHSSVLPVGHAVMLLNEKPVDIVWRKEMGTNARSDDASKSMSTFLHRAKWCIEHNVYWVLQVDAALYFNYITAKQSYGVLDDWERRWPFVRLGPEQALASLVLDKESKRVL